MPGASQKRQSKKEEAQMQIDAEVWVCHEVGVHASVSVYAHINLRVGEMVLQKSKTSFGLAQEKRLRGK